MQQMIYSNSIGNSYEQQRHSYDSWDKLGVPEVVYSDQWRFDVDKQTSNSYPSSYDSEFIPPHKIYKETSSLLESISNSMAYPNSISMEQNSMEQPLNYYGHDYGLEFGHDMDYDNDSIPIEDDDLFFQMSPSLPSLPSPISVHSSPRRSSLKKPKKVKEYKDGKCFPCDMCSSTFSRNHDLKRHVRIHLGIRPYKCETCTKSFTRMDALNRHRTVKGCKDD